VYTHPGIQEERREVDTRDTKKKVGYQEVYPRGGGENERTL